MEKFISTFLQGHAHMANEQEKALEVATNKVQSRMNALVNLLKEAHEGTMELKATLQLLVPVVLDLSARQVAMEDVRPLSHCCTSLMLFVEICSNVLYTDQRYRAVADAFAEAGTGTSRCLWDSQEFGSSC
jgi:hypothetical protein